jgi:hypothetical protein
VLIIEFAAALDAGGAQAVEQRLGGGAPLVHLASGFFGHRSPLASTRTAPGFQPPAETRKAAPSMPKKRKRLALLAAGSLAAGLAIGVALLLGVVARLGGFGGGLLFDDPGARLAEHLGQLQEV